MGLAHVLPPVLDSACEQGHPVELWVLDGNQLVKCRGAFLGKDERGRPRVSLSLPDGFIGVMRGGCAVRAFFSDPAGKILTFVSSLRDWQPYRDRPTSAAAVLEAPAVVTSCQRRGDARQFLDDLPVALSIGIRGEREVVQGRIVDASAGGLGVRMLRSTFNWFGTGTAMQAELALPTDAPLHLDVTVARIGIEGLHYFYGMRISPGSRDHARYLTYLGSAPATRTTP